HAAVCGLHESIVHATPSSQSMAAPGLQMPLTHDSTPLQRLLSWHCALFWQGWPEVQPFCRTMQNWPGGHRLLSATWVQAFVASSHASTVHAMLSDAHETGVPALQPVGPCPAGSQVSAPLQKRPSSHAT